MPKTAVGGTFEYLHDGHRKLLRRAFEIAAGDLLDIGLTSDSMAGQKDRNIPSYATRRNQLEDYIASLDIPDKKYQIEKLEDPFGTTVNGDYRYIVVSPETYAVAEKINKLRREDGKEQLEIVKIDYVMAEDEKPISSTRISNGEIDIHGHLRGKF
jgi:pantetheine-phosphate adenylyltransferase